MSTAVEETDESDGSFFREILEWIVVLVGAITVAMVLRAFVVTAFSIPSESMEDTLLVGDRVVVSRLDYRLGSIDRTDVLVFDQLESIPDGPDHLIKRVIALGGEQVRGLDGQVSVAAAGSDEWVVLDEPYLDDGVTTSDFGPIEVPADSIWVMGDNRERSADSRSFGPVGVDRVVGHAVLIYWPLDRIGGL